MEQDLFTNSSELSLSSEVSPKILIIRVLEACNAGCFMCDFAFSNDTYRFSHKDAINIVNQISRSEIKVVRLTGGEPLLLPDIKEILSTFKQENLTTSMITNGFYLPNAKLLSENLLDHVIVSIDGASAEKHDRYRQLPNLYENICAGIKLLQQMSPSTVIRVNTVVGKHNLKDLKQIYDNLCELKVAQWSIIPLKQGDSTWGNFSVEQFLDYLESFNRHVAANPSSIKLLGHSLNWLGREDEEIRRNWEKKRPSTPNGSCFLVDQVRYYIPKEGIVFPCNCVPHRIDSAELATNWSEDALFSTGLKDSRGWLKKFGPSHCMGCEPVNVALGEGDIDLNTDPLGF